MYSYRFISHTADKGIKITADTLPGLFEGAMKGMAAIQKKQAVDQSPEDKQSFRISVSAPDRTALLIDFLSEILTLSDIHHFVFTQITFDKLSNRHVEATISGHRMEDFDEDIKAVTHYLAEIVKNEDDNFETTVVFDI